MQEFSLCRLYKIKSKFMREFDRRPVATCELIRAQQVHGEQAMAVHHHHHQNRSTMVDTRSTVDTFSAVDQGSQHGKIAASGMSMATDNELFGTWRTCIIGTVMKKV